MKNLTSFTYNGNVYYIKTRMMYNHVEIEIVAIKGQVVHCYQELTYHSDGKYKSINDILIERGFDIEGSTLKFIINTRQFDFLDDALNDLFSHVTPYVKTKSIDELNCGKKGLSNYWQFISNAIINA